MKEHGTPFKAEMVRALLRDVEPKTQTRRLFTRHNSLVDGGRASRAMWDALNFDDAWTDDGPSPAGSRGPYLKVPHRSAGTVHRVYATIESGDRLWMREAHYLTDDGDHEFAVYAADSGAVEEHRQRIAQLPSSFPEDVRARHLKLRPSIHLPRWACRLTLDVPHVRIQRLQQINEYDAKAEGCAPAWLDADDGVTVHAHQQPTYRRGYARLWREIHGDASWEANPWVRVFELRKASP